MKLKNPFHTRLNLASKGLLIIAVPLGIEFLLLLSLSILVNIADQQAKRLDSFKNIMANIESIGKLYTDAINDLVIYGATNKPEASEKYNQCAWEITRKLDYLRDLLPVMPRHRLAIERTLTVAEEALATLDDTKRTIATSSGFAAMAQLKSLPVHFAAISNNLVGELSDLIQEIKESERLNPEDAARSQLIVHLTLVAGLVISVIFILAALLFYRGMTSRLAVLMDNTDRLVRDETLQPVMSGSDEIASLDKVFHNMADALKKADERERQLQQYKQQFVSMLSHDLRTPLTSVELFLDMLGEGRYGGLDERGLKCTKIADNSIRRVIGMVNDLLDIDKLEAGMLTLQIEEARMQEIIEHSIESVKNSAEQNEVRLESESTDLTARVDANRVTRVLINLLGNAIKFSPPDTTVSVSSRLVDGAVELKVRDQGRGIPESHRKLIFDRFEQVQIEDSRARGGSGLGLAICKAIVEAHGGTIGVESEEGKGSEFWVRLPANPSEYEKHDS